MWIVLVAIVMVAALAACGGGTPSSSGAEIDAATLVQNRCTQCHSLDKVTSVQMTQAQWDQTVSNMIQKGAQLSGDEHVAVVAYLAETYGP